jgi:hypothetical protein
MSKKIRPLFGFICFFVLAPLSAETDLIVMVDISASMDPYFDDVVGYLLDDLMKTMLGWSDRFHFLSFSGSPEVEISETIEDTGSLERILMKIRHLQPIGLYTDLVSAVKFLTSFAAGLPEDRSKSILLLTDGVHEPAPESPYPAGSPDVLQELLEEAETIRKEGWRVHILRMPGKKQPAVLDETGIDRTPDEESEAAPPDDESAEERVDYLDELASALDSELLDYDQIDGEELAGRLAGAVTLEYPGNLGRVRSPFSARFYLSNRGDERLSLIFQRMESEGRNILRESVQVSVSPGQRKALDVTVVLPESYAIGPHEMPVTLFFLPDDQVSPDTGFLSFEYAGPAAPRSLLPLYIALGSIAVLVVVALSVVLFLYMRSRLEKNYFDLFMRKNRTGRGAELIEMRVQLQNPHVGFRNIHPMSRGMRRSVGGGHSSFLIFLVPFPSHAAEISFDGQLYTFSPIKQAHFPGLQGELADCLDEDIPAVSSKGYAFSLKFKRYSSPLEEINRLLSRFKSAASRTTART